MFCHQWERVALCSELLVTLSIIISHHNFTFGTFPSLWSSTDGWDVQLTCWYKYQLLIVDLVSSVFLVAGMKTAVVDDGRSSN